MKKYFNFLILLLAAMVLFVSCNQEEAAAPRATTKEDDAIVTSVVEDVKATSEDGDAGQKAIGPYLDVIINGLFAGDGTSIDGVNIKFTDKDYKYETAKEESVNFEALPLTVTLDNVDIVSGEYAGKKVSGTFNLTYDEENHKQVIKGELTGGDIEYTGTIEDFYNDVFNDHIMYKFAEDCLAQGITLKGDELKVYVKGSIEYAKGKDEAGNDNGKIAFQKIEITDFSLETKKDIALEKNKYSLKITGTTKLDFTPDEDCSGTELKGAEIKASMKMGISNETEKHSLEVSSSINYPSKLSEKIPVDFAITDAKIDDELITNESMTLLIGKLLAGIFNS